MPMIRCCPGRRSEPKGFDIIAAVAGEIKEPLRTVPRAMLLSLPIALAIYILLLIVVTAAGTAPGESIMILSAVHPETGKQLTQHPFYNGFDRSFVALHDHYRCLGVAGHFFRNFTEQHI